MKKIIIAIVMCLFITLGHAQDYLGKNVGSLGGSTAGYALSSFGEVIGESEIDLYGDRHAFSWTPKWGMFDVDAFAGQHLDVCGSNPCPGDNSHQAFVGSYGPAGTSHAFMWGFNLYDLGTFGGQTSIALGINDAMQVVGGADLPSGQRHAFSWSWTSGMVDLDSNPGYGSYAVAINSLGQVAGVRDHGDGSSSVFLWTAEDGLQELGFQGRPYAINDLGEIVGTLDPAGHAFYWSRLTGMKDLGTLPGHVYSEAVSINNHSQVAGTSTSSSAFVPFIWTPAAGMKPLPAMKGRWYSASINDAGQILLNHYFGRGRSAAKVLTPRVLVTLTSTPNPSRVGETVTFTAKAISVQGPVEGLIAFWIDHKQHQAGSPGGTAVFTTTDLPVGTHTVTAQYLGDTIYHRSMSNAVEQVVTE